MRSTIWSSSFLFLLFFNFWNIPVVWKWAGGTNTPMFYSCSIIIYHYLGRIMDLAASRARPADFYISVGLMYVYAHMWMLTYTWKDSYTQAPAHIHLLLRQCWSDSDITVVLLGTCIEFPIRKPFLTVCFCAVREPVAGDPLRQEVRENHLGHKGAWKKSAGG